MKIVALMKKWALSIMMSGFVIALTGVIIVMRTRQMGNNLPAIGIGITVLGLIMYILGRIFVAINRSEAKARDRVKNRSE